MPEPDGSPPPLPDVREVDGWVYSSLPIEAAVGAGEIVVRRLRQTVSPAGELSERANEVRLRPLSAEQLEAEAPPKRAWRRSGAARSPTDIHVGSTVVVLGRRR